MSSKPETTFTAAVHRHLPLTVYREKMHNMYRGGTADVWYDGPKGDLWVEYKFIVLPKRPETEIDTRRLFSELQIQWLRNRYTNGRNVASIIGCKQGGITLSACAWEQPMETRMFLECMQDRSSIANWIAAQVL